MSEQVSEARIPWRALVGDQEPDSWLENARRTLLFHSHCSMHQAIAGATGLSYHSVHKCLSGSRKPRRIPDAIRECLNGWLNCAADGGAPDIPDEFRAVPAERMMDMLPALLRRYDTKSALYQAIAERTGVQPTTVRRYFYESGRVCYAPLSVYRVAQDLVGEPEGEPLADSYLSDDRTRHLAHCLARECRDVLVRWRSNGHDPELEVRYRNLRRALITTIKEQRAAPLEGCSD